MINLIDNRLPIPDNAVKPPSRPYVKFLRFELKGKEDGWLRFQSPLIGIAVLLLITSPIVLIGYFTFGVPIIIASILGVLGLKHFLGYFLWWY